MEGTNTHQRYRAASPFALWYKGQRQTLGMNKNQIARISGVKRTTILMMEQNGSDPSLLMAMKLVKAIGKTLRDFEDYMNQDQSGVTPDTMI